MKYAVLFIALLFAGCGGWSSTEEAASTDGGYETITISGETIQVAKEDFSSEMNWDVAMSACAGLGNGWRLPNKEELSVMYEQLHKQGKGNFKEKYYWSSSRYYSGEFATGVYFGNGNVGNPYGDYKTNNYQVRAVRTLP